MWWLGFFIFEFLWLLVFFCLGFIAEILLLVFFCLGFIDEILLQWWLNFSCMVHGLACGWWLGCWLVGMGLVFGYGFDMGGG